MSDIKTAQERADRLLEYLASDPENTALRLDAAQACQDADRPEDATRLLQPPEAPPPTDPQSLYLLGTAAMKTGSYEDAVFTFTALTGMGHKDPAIIFNLAWSEAHLKAFKSALNHLTPETCEALPQAAMLRVQLMHQLGDFEGAGEYARKAIACHPDHPGLLGAVSTLAIDLEDRVLARETAEKAPENSEAVTTLGTLALEDGELQLALTRFEQAVTLAPSQPRGWVGRGLTHLAAGDQAQGARDLDKGAALFGTHLGSWIAAGWAWFVQEDYAAAKARFEKALQIDANFAETHGSLAVIALTENKPDQAKRLIRTAFGLDKQCFSAAFAQSLLLASEGKAEMSEEVIARALTAPIDESGQTLAHALTRLGVGGRTVH